MTSDLTLSEAEIVRLTGYEQPCKQLATLKARGFHRAYIARKGGVVLERTHYEAVSRGESSGGIVKAANVSFMRRSA